MSKITNLKRFVAAFLLFVLSAQSAGAVTRTYTVNYAVSEAENPDTSPGDGICVSFDFGGGDIKCTLTGAIDEAKANPGDDVTILFDNNYTIGAGGAFVEDGYAWKVIPDAGAFNSLTIDGGTNTIQLHPGMSFADTVFGIFSDNVTLTNLYIYDATGDADGVYIDSTSDNVTLDNLTLGLDSTDTAQSLTNGVEISGQNVDVVNSTISGNVGKGISIGPSAKDVTISSNIIGTDGSDNSGLGNATGGIYFTGGTPENFNGGDGGVEGIVIGGAAGTDKNIIVGNGVGVSFPTATLSGDLNISNNYIGLASDGLTELPNTSGGVYIEDNVADGLDITIADNLISGNSGVGVDIRSGNTVTMTGNSIGVDLVGASSPNTGDGAYLDAITLLIGSMVNGNTFGNNTGNGLQIKGDDTATATIIGNTFSSNTLNGLKITTVALAGAVIDVQNNLFESNTGDGFNTDLAAGTATLDFGSTNDGEGNRVRSNGGDGVELAEGLTVVTFHGNRVGLNEAGTAAAANTGAGLKIDSSTMTSFVAGTVLTAARNVISGNGANGVYIVDMADAATALFKNNYIGLTSDGTAAVANTGSGVLVEDGNTTFGSTTAGEGNVISGNTSNGIQFNSTATITASILGNYIGLNAAGTAAIANLNGLKISSADLTATIGAENGANVIAGNTTNDIIASSGTSLTFYANKIGVAADGTTVISDNTNPVTIASVGTLVFGGAGVLKNTVSNTNSIGVLVTGMTITALDAINTWTVTTGPFAETGPKFWYWKDTSTHSPTECSDSYDNDGDGVTDLSDPGCPSATGDNEASADPAVAAAPSGGGISMVISHINQISREEREAEQEAAVEEEVAEEAEVEAQAEEEAVAEGQAAEAAAEAEVENNDVVEAAPAEAEVEVVTAPAPRPSIFKDQAIEVDPVVEKRQETLNEFEQVSAEAQNQPEVAAAPKEVNKFVDEILSDEVAPDVQEVLFEVIQYKEEGKIEDIFNEKTEADLIPLVRGVDGNAVRITKKTKIVFEENYQEALKKQKQAAQNGQDLLVMTSFTDFDQNGVADLLEIGLSRDDSQGDQLEEEGMSLADKIFFGEVNLFKKRLKTGGTEVDSGKFRITNYPSIGATVGSEIMLWVAGGEVGDEFEVILIDKATGKETMVGSATMDEGKKGVMPAKFDADGEYYVVVQDKSGDGSVIKVTVDSKLDNKVERLKLVGKSKEKSTETAFNLTDSMYNSVLLAGNIQAKPARQLQGDHILTGYAEPGTMVFVTWQSTVFNSVVIADAGEGYYEINVPENLPAGSHRATAYNYNPKNESFSGMLGLLFQK